jgi:nanoRNase/pAp phosphatase (c-di-AMP/oligoRNAs hydrolase)
MKSSRRLLNFLSKRGKKLSPLLILTHDYPDPDAIAIPILTPLRLHGR